MAIDQALASGESCRSIVSRYFTIGRMALDRHKASHLPAAIVRAQEVEDVRQALDVVQQLKAINAASREILTAARKSGDGELALKAIDRIFKQIELQAKLLGELEQEGTVSILLAPEWVQVRALVLTALVPFPEARGAVAANLAKLEATGG